ncbi:MAG TPA: Fic family protein [Vulgatibacter sp.]|nr:Fic family protein [Vulgatibacter sp.]
MSTRFFALDARNRELAERLEARPDLAAEFHRRYEMSWLHHENALEGLVITPDELVQALEHHVVGDASFMNLIAAVRAHRRALERVRAEASKRSRVGVPFLEELHRILSSADGPRRRETWRREMPLHRTYSHELAQPDRIEEELTKLIKSLASAEFREMHPIRQAAKAHWSFMRVFPFAEHNGRVARLLQTLYLLRGGYPPVIIHATDRQRYHDALRHPSAVLRGLLTDALEYTLESSFRWLEQLTEVGRRAV